MVSVLDPERNKNITQIRRPNLHESITCFKILGSHPDTRTVVQFCPRLLLSNEGVSAYFLDKLSQLL